MKNEAHLPTQQTEAEENFGIPRPDENSRRPQGHQPPPQIGPQKAGRLKFPKSRRLLRRPEFLRLQKSGQRLVGKLICVDYRQTESGPRLGITASSRYGDAPERNRFKRIAREAFRTSLDSIPQKLDIHLVPRQRAKEATSAEVRNELLALLSTAVLK